MIRQSKPFPVPGCSDPVDLQMRLQKVGLPRWLRDRIVLAVKRVSAPGETTRRRRLAREIDASPLLDRIDIDRLIRDGAILIPSSTLASALPAAVALDRLFEDMRKAGRIQKDDTARKGQFLIPVVDEKDLLEIPEVIDFVLGVEIITLATRYFREVPLLSDVGLMWSPPNELCAESQRYHRDGEDKTQLKVFLNVKDVDQACGPLTFVPAHVGDRLPRTRRHSARWDDAPVEAAAGAGAVSQVIGPQGTVAAVDTSRCLHYGSRGNRRERLMLFVQFNRYLAPKARMPLWRIDENVTKEPGTLSKLRDMVMNLG